MLIEGLRAAGRPLAQLLFPPVCPGCRTAIARAPAVCSACWSQLRFIERPFCEVLGLPFASDPGEGDLGEGVLSAGALADPPPFARLRAAVAYRDLAARLVAQLKYGDRTDLVPLMAAWMARAGTELLGDAEVVMPVPLHRGRLFHRRFNQSAELARALAASAGLPYRPLALARVKATRTQVGLGSRERRLNVRGAFRVVPGREGEVAGRRVLLVDDVFTTGATVSAATRALRRAGARDVDVLAFARVVTADG